MRRKGFHITPAIKGKDSVEEGIKFLQTYDVHIHPRCEHTIGEFLTYSYKVDPRTDEVLPQLIDRNNHCIAEGALVRCDRGEVPIEDVTTNDLVLTRCGYRRVLFAGCTGLYREIVCVETTEGFVQCTPDHEIWTENKGWTRADALHYNDEIIILGSHQWQSGPRGLDGTAAYIASMAKMATFSVLSMESPILSIEICGNFIRGLFLRATSPPHG